MHRYTLLTVGMILLIIIALTLVLVLVSPYVWNMLIWKEAMVRWLQRKEARDPNNPRGAARLGFLYQCRMTRSSGPARQEAAQQVVAHCERWLKLHGDVIHDYSKLSALAMAAVEAGLASKARMHATRLLQLAARNKNQRYGNAIHYGNIVLGRLALRHEDIAEAKKLLLKAGATPGSPQLNSSGPSMILAQELLQQGERDVVLRYFDLCATFWTMDKRHGLLTQWAEEVEDGKTPDFGNNLMRG